MKRILISIIVIILALLFFETVYAVEPKNITQTNTTSDLIKVQEKTKTQIENYTEKYGSESYGMTAYIINKVRIYSIPLCFLGIAIGALYQYVIGTRRLDMRHKGFAVIMTSVTILVICQVLPLIFAVVVIGWRG